MELNQVGRGGGEESKLCRVDRLSVQSLACVWLPHVTD